MIIDGTFITQCLSNVLNWCIIISLAIIIAVVCIMLVALVLGLVGYVFRWINGSGKGK